MTLLRELSVFAGISCFFALLINSSCNGAKNDSTTIKPWNILVSERNLSSAVNNTSNASRQSQKGSHSNKTKSVGGNRTTANKPSKNSNATKLETKNAQGDVDEISLYIENRRKVQPQLVALTKTPPRADGVTATTSSKVKADDHTGRVGKGGSTRGAGARKVLEDTSKNDDSVCAMDAEGGIEEYCRRQDDGLYYDPWNPWCGYIDCAEGVGSRQVCAKGSWMGMKVAMLQIGHNRLCRRPIDFRPINGACFEVTDYDLCGRNATLSLNSTEHPASKIT